MNEFFSAFAWTLLGVMMGIAIMNVVQAFRELKAEDQEEGDNNNE